MARSKEIITAFTIGGILSVAGCLPPGEAPKNNCGVTIGPVASPTTEPSPGGIRVDLCDNSTPSARPLTAIVRRGRVL